MRLFCLLHTAVSTSRGELCFFRRHSPPFEIVGQQSEVRFDFAGKFVFGALVGQETA
jgi:hypothetical protein